MREYVLYQEYIEPGTDIAKITERVSELERTLGSGTCLSLVVTSSAIGNYPKSMQGKKALDAMVTMYGKGVVLTDYGTFDFVKKEYIWNLRKVYLTVHEQIAIYSILVQHKLGSGNISFLLNARKRIGTDFLSDVVTEKYTFRKRS